MTADFLAEDEEFSGGYDRRVVGRLGRFLKPYAVQVAVSVVLLVLVAILDVAGPLILKEAIDGQISKGRTDRLAFLAVLFLGTLLAGFFLRYVQGVLMTYVGQRVMMDLRLALFRHLQRMSIAFFDRNPAGRLITRVTNDVATLEQVISQGVVAIITNILMVGAIIVVLFFLDWRLSLVMYLTLPPLVFCVSRIAGAQRIAFGEQRAWLSRINAYLNENITGMAVIQLFNRQTENLRRFTGRNRALLDANLRVVATYAIFEPTVVLFGALTTGLILWYGGGRVIQSALTLGTLVAFLQYMQRFYWPIRDLSDRITTLQQAFASCERMFRVLDEPEEVVDAGASVHLQDIRGEIEFKNVWFAYDEGNWVLRDISFHLEPGEKVAIVGATGAGKSTMMSLLNRFYDIREGAILVDGVSITDIPQRELRRHVGLVLQDPFIFTDTVEANIRMRDASISLDEVKAAARLVGADAFIMKMVDGYETLLAERGANLSTGQKQLLALARVAAFNPEIVLVMDEATASIDPETEASLQRSIREVTAHRTLIIIAHRLNTIRFVDRILVLSQGRIVEEGTHEELLGRGGAYFRLYELQYKDQDLTVSP
jgi:ATP-binding cassette subfamily B multidrug efflux pump